MGVDLVMSQVTHIEEELNALSISSVYILTAALRAAIGHFLIDNFPFFNVRQSLQPDSTGCSQ